MCIFRMSYAPGYPQPGYPGAGAHQPHHSQSFPQPPHGSPAPHGFPGAPPPQHAPQPQGASNIPTTGQAEGAQFRIDHRDSNSMLYVRLQPGAEIKAKPGSMVAMDATVRIKGKLKFSVKKLLTGGEVRRTPERSAPSGFGTDWCAPQMSESIFTGPGEVLLAPDTWGDIVPIHLDGQTNWSVGRDAFLACTMGVTRSTKSQGLGKAFCTFLGRLAATGIPEGALALTLTTRCLQSPEKVSSCITLTAAA